MNPRVSVILCGYNRAAYLDDAITSALGQTHENVELILVDNGSTDASREIATTYQGDPRVRLLLHPTNAAVTKRLKEAVAVSSGEYISLLYADDYYLPHKLEYVEGVGLHSQRDVCPAGRRVRQSDFPLNPQAVLHRLPIPRRPVHRRRIDPMAAQTTAAFANARRVGVVHLADRRRSGIDRMLNAARDHKAVIAFKEDYS